MRKVENKRNWPDCLKGSLYFFNIPQIVSLCTNHLTSEHQLSYLALYPHLALSSYVTPPLAIFVLLHLIIKWHQTSTLYHLQEQQQLHSQQWPPPPCPELFQIPTLPQPYGVKRHLLPQDLLQLLYRQLRQSMLAYSMKIQDVCSMYSCWHSC
jgi:hypothetical protein